MGNFQIFDRWGMIIGLAVFLASFILFFKDTRFPIGSFTAALMTAALVWATYVILRWLLLANKNS
jgi:hypothetical protein